MGQLVYDMDQSDSTVLELRKNITEQLVLYKTKFLVLYRNLFWSAEWTMQQQLPSVHLPVQRVGSLRGLKFDSPVNRALLSPSKGDCEATAGASPGNSQFPFRQLQRKKELSISLDLAVPVKKLYLNQGLIGAYGVKPTSEHSTKADCWFHDDLSPQKLPYQKVDFSSLSRLTEMFSVTSRAHIDSMNYFLDRELTYMYSIIPITTFDSVLSEDHNYETLKPQLDLEYSRLLKLNR